MKKSIFWAAALILAYFILDAWLGFVALSSDGQLRGLVALLSISVLALAGLVILQLGAGAVLVKEGTARAEEIERLRQRVAGIEEGVKGIHENLAPLVPRINGKLDAIEAKFQAAEEAARLARASRRRAH